MKNSQLNVKETYLTWEQYIKCRIDHFTDLHKHKLLKEDDTTTDLFLRNMASAIVIFELMTVKPSRSILLENNDLENDKNVTNPKGMFFFLISISIFFYLTRFLLVHKRTYRRVSKFHGENIINKV